MAAPRRILLADADAFYVAVARLVDPEGAGKAPLLLVGGSAEGRGVVTSASYEARRFGVHSAMPMARAVRLCPNAMVVPVPMEACVEKGREMRAVLETFSPIVEQASSDEFYLDMAGTERLYNDEPLAETARRIREAVRQATHLKVSVGGGTSKFVAKLAAGLAKPSSPSEPAAAGLAPDESRFPEGVHIVVPGNEAAFMRQFALAELHGIGPRFQERLARFGLHRVDDVLRHDRAQLDAWFGKREGGWLFDRARGSDRSPVERSGDARSISRDDTFSRDVDDDATLGEKLASLVDRATSELRSKGLRARTVSVRIRDADFRDRQASRTLPEPVSADRPVLLSAHQLLRRLRKARGVPARLIGVALSGLVREEGDTQLPLLTAESTAPQDTERDRRLSEAVDALREKFGRNAIRKGTGRR